MRLGQVNFKLGGESFEITLDEYFYNSSRVFQLDCLNDLISDLTDAYDNILSQDEGGFSDYIGNLPDSSPNWVMQRKKMKGK